MAKSKIKWNFYDKQDVKIQAEELIEKAIQMTEGLQFDKPLEKYYKQCLVKKIALNTASNVIDAIRATHNDEPVAVKEYRMYWECIYTFINTDGEKCEPL